MKFIEKVVLENFQSHKNTSIEFDKGLNIIVGPSDSGKTSILRGLKWALYNDPSGDYFIREGETDCSVTVFFSDNTKIKRFRSKSKNAYFLYDKDNNETIYEGFGTSVPHEVLELTGIKKILLDKDTSKSVNISEQLEGAFLLSEKNSTKANSIGYLVGVDVIDDALRETLKDSRNLSNNKKSIDNDINMLEKELSEYAYLEEVSKKIIKLDRIRKEINTKTKYLEIYKKLLLSKSSINNEKKKVEYYIHKLKDLQKVEFEIKDAEFSYMRYNKLTYYNDNLKKILYSKKYNLSLINSLKHTDIVEDYVKKISNFESKQSYLNKLNNNLQKYKSEKNNVKKILKNVSDVDKLKPIVFKVENNAIELNNLINLKSKKNHTEKSLSIGKNYLYKLRNIQTSNEKYSLLKDKMETINKLNKIKNKYENNQIQLNKLNEDLSRYKKITQEMSIKYRDLLLKEGTCPLCFSNIDTEKVEHIITQYI